MDHLNYMTQDVLGALIAFGLFSILLIPPGYGLGWLLDLFDFRRRRLVVRLGLALLLSIAVSPVVIYLLYLWLSVWAVLGVLLACLALTMGLLGREAWLRRGAWPVPVPAGVRWVQRLLLGIGCAWVIVVIGSLIDIQTGNRLYYSVVSFDYATRVLIVDAITHSGVPPINPSYYPGHPVPLTYIYYFWYVLVSLVDQLGGGWVDARMAFAGSAAWCGLAVMAAVGLYLRQRCPDGPRVAWRLAFKGIALLGVSGLDIIPVSIFALMALRWGPVMIWGGAIESWNQQVSAWPGITLWVPHHVAATLAGWVGMMLFLHGSGIPAGWPGWRRPLTLALVAGLAFASAAGLSTWVALVWAVFWGMWMIAVLGWEKQPRRAGWMLVAGLVAILAALPFLRGVISPGTGQMGAAGGLPVAFSVRAFSPADPFIQNGSTLQKNLVYLALLPVNYLFELGFFFITTLLWLKYRRILGWRESRYKTAEAILLLCVFVITSFFRARVIAANDLGYRGWLPGQLVLIIWALDVFPLLRGRLASGSPALATSPDRERTRLRVYLVALMGIGALTAGVDLILLRTYPMIGDYSVHFRYDAGTAIDQHVGERTLAGRQMYTYLRDHLPPDIIYQYNPTIHLDRPSGLYGGGQTVISDHTAYGVTEQEFQHRIEQVGEIFNRPAGLTWEPIDRLCHENSIAVIVVGDLDALWAGVDRLSPVRRTLYQNEYYKVFPCGNLQDGQGINPGGT